MLLQLQSESLDDILPTLSEFCDFLREYISPSTPGGIFILKQLLLGSVLFDTDEVGRAKLASLLGINPKFLNVKSTYC